MAGLKKASKKEPLRVSEWPVINLRLPPELVADLADFCEQTDRKRQDAVRFAIKELIARHKKAS